jgi:hypothetical protein
MRSSSGMLGGHDAKSEGGTSRGSRMHRSPSFIAAEFNDDTDREKAHLKEVNTTLEERVKQLRAQVTDLRSQGLSRDAQKNMQQLEEDNELIRKDIATLRGKVQAASSVELLDKLTDELAGKEVDLKALHVRVKDVSEENYANAKLVRHADKHPDQNPQAVFLDLKNERRRFQKRLDKTRANIEKSREAHEQITKRLREIEEKQTELGLNELTHDKIVSTEKAFKANEEKIDKLKRKLVSFEGTFAVRSMQTTRKSVQLAEEVSELQGKVRVLEAQVMKIEHNIMQNQKLRERPPHFIEPLEMKTPPVAALSATQQQHAKTPRPQKPTQPPPPVSARSKQTAQKQAPPPAKKKAAAAAPAPKPKTKSAAKAQEEPKKREATPPDAAAAADDDQAASQEEGKLNDLNDTSPTPPRSPTPPVRSPTPPADDDDAGYKSGSYRGTPTPPRSPTPVQRSPTPAEEETTTKDDVDAEQEEKAPSAPRSPAPPSVGRPESASPRNQSPQPTGGDDAPPGDADAAADDAPKDEAEEGEDPAKGDAAPAADDDAAGGDDYGEDDDFASEEASPTKNDGDKVAKDTEDQEPAFLTE